MFEIRLKNSDEIIDGVQCKINYEENKAPIVNFKLLPNSNFFNKLKKFIDLIEIYKINDKADDEKIFDGRVLDVKKEMTSDGMFYNDVICEGLLNYLIDSTVGLWELHPAEVPKDSPAYAEANYDTRKFLKKILDNHNSKVDDKKKIYLGNVTLIDSVYCITNRETSLNVIYDKLVNNKGGFLNLREVDGKYYLDYLKENPVKDESNVEIGVNLKDIQVEDSLKSICTRLIGVGSEGKITSVAEDLELIKQYGIIEQVYEWSDVTIQENLDSKVKEKLKLINESNSIVSINALDLSYLDNNLERLKLSQNINVVCEPLEYEKKHRIVKIDLDLQKPYASSFVLNNPEPSQVGTSNNIIQETNNNKLEILQVNGRLIQKVSSSEFMSYREQTDKSIKERVSNGEFETYKNQTAYEISQKVGSKDVATIFEQKMDRFNFTIGKTTPLSIQKDRLDMEFEDGTKCMIDRNGFGYQENGKTYPYRSMVDVKGFNTKGDPNSLHWVQLPDRYKNKQFKTMAVITDSSDESWQIDKCWVIQRMVVLVEDENIDYANARVPIRGYRTDKNYSTGDIRHKPIAGALIVIA